MEKTDSSACKFTEQNSPLWLTACSLPGWTLFRNHVEHDRFAGPGADRQALLLATLTLVVGQDLLSSWRPMHGGGE